MAEAPQGYSTTVSAGAMVNPLILRTSDNGAMIRSITVGNQTTTTTAVVYGSIAPQGQPLFAVMPGQFSTLPIAAKSGGLSLVFVCQTGFAFNGAIYVHIDPQPLSASSFQSTPQAPLWVWDSSAWDGGAVWSG